MTTLAAAQLRLADRSGTDGVVESQDPLAGAEVPVGTPVAVVLRSSVAPETRAAASSSFPTLLIGVALALLFVGVAVVEAAHLRRSRTARREQQWMDDHVAVNLGEATSPRQFSRVPAGTVPAVDVRLTVRHGPGAPRPQEVGNARNDPDG
jgi:hypothetical protein